MRVKRSAIELVAGSVLPLSWRKIQIRPVASRLIRFNARPANFVSKQPADGKRSISNRFSIEAKASLTGEPTVLGIALLELRSLLRRLAVRARQDDQGDTLDGWPLASICLWPRGQGIRSWSRRQLTRLWAWRMRPRRKLWNGEITRGCSMDVL